VSGPVDAGLSVALEGEALRELGLDACFDGRPVVLEIGFGRAELILALAQADPARGYLGVEVSRKRVAKAARRAEKAGIGNVRLVHSNAEFVVERALPPSSISECWINFSDPWPKKRHFKRRLFQPDFVARLCGVLEPGAPLHVATDHAGYAEWIDEVLAAAPGLENLCGPRRVSDTAPARPVTAYEAEWLAEGRRIAYFEYRRK
jgi:tRNA (guanine-N7-)-methyltransferase